ncbi:cyclophilin-like fold protein [Candidatus Enterococcus ferrettii]|uniref:Cyclophilin-like domain-containing protein n=1 Tax=Candidatus Enterococcus ferrettii TaxID=2815324 RepID=A0ABV0ESJ9_9ENTE|nr:cyclophilin-like fold protein [Enterococcus sp. 665A]MBO1343029.1 hypothetical protein [Enterococcus sp. 665A]
MKKYIPILLLSFILSGCSLSSSDEATSSTSEVYTPSTNQESLNQTASSVQHLESEENEAMTNLSIKVGNQNFNATFTDNATSRAFKDKLPMTLDMDELNGNEKFFYLPEELPTNTERIGAIQNGDLMLYGTDCLVLFYKSFSTSYSYSRIARVDDPSGLAQALGHRGVVITFELNE